MDQFRVGEEKDVGAGEDFFFFKIQVQQYRTLNLDANFNVNFLSSDI